MIVLLRYIKIIVVTLFLFPIFIKADCEICDFTIDEIFFNESIVGYYMAGFDMSTGNSNVLLFEYLINGPSACYYSSSGNEELIIDFSIEIFSPELGYTTQETFISGSLTLSDFTGPVRLKNTDINFSTTIVDGASMEVTEITTPEPDRLENMISYIMSSGKIPNGTYLFSFELRSGSNENTCGDQVIDSFTRDIEIYEPSFLDLQSPGYKNKAEVDQSTSEMTTYTNFIWSADMCSACEYGIRVCEYDPLMHDSPSAALNDQSNLPADQSLDYFPITGGSSVFTYPASGGVDLAMEKYYVWQIRRTYGTTVGMKEDLSEIYIYKISANQSSSASDLEFLIELIGQEAFDQYFGPGGDLNGYSLSAMQLNGNSLTLQDLESIINSIKEGNREVEGVTVD
jgi:hypothetical protein